MMSYGIMGVTTTPEIGHHRQPWVRTTTLQEWMEYQKAVSYYAKALTFPTKSLSAFAGLAYTYHLMVFFLILSHLLFHTIFVTVMLSCHTKMYLYRLEVVDDFEAAINYYHKVCPFDHFNFINSSLAHS
ncbi:hypothetical protein Zm00014a_009802 [Zea mays]|uniref:Uncharacterized protein n=1 Tax=Zea mays TaxID=4577 RepID=A0A3L6DHH2_MAIZE|nr:hypothetical protein Zm00014a_009802 [Zea mays]